MATKRTKNPTGAYVRVDHVHPTKGPMEDGYYEGITAMCWAKDEATAIALIRKAMGRKLKRDEAWVSYPDVSKIPTASIMLYQMTKGRAEYWRPAIDAAKRRVRAEHR